MKIALVCDSPLLNKTLELHLQRYLTSLNHCDLIVSDHKVKALKPVFLVGDCEGSLLKSPFSRQNLLTQIKKFYTQKTATKPTPTPATIEEDTQDINTEIPKAQRARYNKNLQEAKELLEIIHPSGNGNKDAQEELLINHSTPNSLLRNPKFLADLQILHKNFTKALMALIAKYEK